MEKISDLTETKRGVYFVLGLSAIIKVLVLIALSDKAINNDGLLYISAAQQFASGHFKEGLAIYQMPLFPLLITAVHFVVHNWIFAARLVSSAALVMALIPLYMLTSELFNRKAAFWACLLFSLAPEPNLWAADIIRGPAFVFFLAWAAFFAQRSIQSIKPTDFLLTFFFIGISILFRIEGLIFIPFYILFIIGLGIAKPRERIVLFKNILVWIVFLIIVFSILFVITGPEGADFNRLDKAVHEAKKIFSLKYFDKYHHIYQELKTLEDSSQFIGHGKQNLIAITRHYMPVIYLLGFLESLIKVLFPFFIIPLYCGFKRPFYRNQVLILSFVASNLIMVYCYAIRSDFISQRFLFAPAFLLYPWIGAGMERIFVSLRKSSKQKILAAVFTFIFLLVPVGKVVNSCMKHDIVISRAGKWLAKETKFQNAKILTTDLRIPFYAGREIYSSSEKGLLKYDKKSKDYIDMEQFAVANQVDFIIIRLSKNEKDLIPQFEQFIKIKEFHGKKRIAVIFFHK